MRATLELAKPITALNIDINENKLSALGYVKEKHGHWIPHILKNADIQWGFNCSECGEWFVVGQNLIKNRYLYCPKCGTKMDEVEENKDEQ